MPVQKTICAGFLVNYKKPFPRALEFHDIFILLEKNIFNNDRLFC